jgi:phenylalanine-4-hydroxylase
MRKEVQKLTSCIVALNRFIAKLADKSLPFFSVLRGSTKVEWGPEQQRAFDDLKQYLQHLPILSSPEQGQPLILYVSATHSVVSRALVIEKDATQAGAMTKQ